uniref:Creb/atf bzip transcription factor ixodes scapularis creb/atf bzip transcription factor n=1 Tax=Rhipicephalus appendiculatus TaxID=34631 RepID=A0A131YKK1_RHIAP
MDAGPILRDIMMGHFWDGGAEGGDSIFSDIAVGEPSPTTDEERGGAQYEPTGLTPTSPTRSPKSRRQSRPNYAVLAGKSRSRAKSEALCSSDEVHVEEYEDEPVSPGYLEDEEEDYSDAVKTRGSCMSKNAIAARENRIKKKLYVNKLERSVRHLSTENATLKRRGQEMSREIEELSEEVQYLRSVLCNADEIKTLVRSIRAARPSLATDPKNGVSLKRERVEEDHDYVATGKRRPPVDKKAGGVCIHVANGTVSLEFCHRCAAKSKDAWREGQ